MCFCLGACEAREPETAGLDEARVKALSHALFEAQDRADEPGFARATSSQFVRISEGEVRERAEVLARLRERRARGAPVRTRSYADERVWIGESSAVYFGRAVEHVPVEGARPTGDFEGGHTLVWARERGAWKAVSLQWIKAGRAAAREMWNDIYREGTQYNQQPNQFLARMIKDRAPGRALDVGMGQGRNAVYLASQGWKVTGIDISDEGIRQAREAAAAGRHAIEAIVADVETWDYGIEQWDLVALIYASGNTDKIRAAVKPGGIVVAEYFHKDAVPAIGVTPAELAQGYKDGFVVLHSEVVEAVSDWGNQHGVPQKLVRFAAQRRAP